jgi:hypothetical protein
MLVLACVGTSSFSDQRTFSIFFFRFWSTSFAVASNYVSPYGHQCKDNNDYRTNDSIYKLAYMTIQTTHIQLKQW